MRPSDRIRGSNQRPMEGLPPLEESRIILTTTVILGLVGAIFIVALAAVITLRRPVITPFPAPLPERIRGTSDRRQGTPMQAILMRWPPEQMPAWAVDTFDPAPGPVPIPLPRPPEAPR